MLTSETIKQEALRLGADVCGIAPVSRFTDAPAGFHPTDILPTCQSVVVFAVQMPLSYTVATNPAPYSHAAYMLYHKLDTVAMGLSAYCHKHGANGVMVPADVPYIAWDDGRKRGQGILSLKHAAVLAGLGIMGKNTLLMNPAMGNMGYIGALLVDVALAADPLMDGFACVAGCSRCTKACPVSAIADGTVDQALCRGHSFLKAGRGWDLYSCKLCRTVCPLKQGV